LEAKEEAKKIKTDFLQYFDHKKILIILPVDNYSKPAEKVNFFIHSPLFYRIKKGADFKIKQPPIINLSITKKYIHTPRDFWFFSYVPRNL
jgi:hypothetical protein